MGGDGRETAQARVSRGCSTGTRTAVEQHCSDCEQVSLARLSCALTSILTGIYRWAKVVSALSEFMS